LLHPRLPFFEHLLTRECQNALQPGYTDTPIIESLYGQLGQEAMGQRMAMLHPWGRTGRPEDIARVAVFMAGEGVAYVTGTGFVVDGGYLAQ
jgi:NAD(P)-dependent dehydrogenase (short-subunit alcohol dehydrogenase family)